MSTLCPLPSSPSCWFFSFHHSRPHLSPPPTSHLSPPSEQRKLLGVKMGERSKALCTTSFLIVKGQTAPNKGRSFSYVYLDSSPQPAARESSSRRSFLAARLYLVFPPAGAVPSTCLDTQPEIFLPLVAWSSAPLTATGGEGHHLESHPPNCHCPEGAT